MGSSVAMLRERGGPEQRLPPGSLQILNRASFSSLFLFGDLFFPLQRSGDDGGAGPKNTSRRAMPLARRMGTQALQCLTGGGGGGPCSSWRVGLGENRRVLQAAWLPWSPRGCSGWALQ